MAHKARDQGGWKKSVEKAAVKNEVPTQAEKRKRQEVSKRFPDDEAGQDQKEEISCYCPVKEDLARMVFVYQGIGFGKAEEIFENRQQYLPLCPIDSYRIWTVGDKTFIDEMRG